RACPRWPRPPPPPRSRPFTTLPSHISLFFFFNDTAPTEIYTLSLHDALPIFWTCQRRPREGLPAACLQCSFRRLVSRSEEHTSELQSLAYLVCRLLLGKIICMSPVPDVAHYAGLRQRYIASCRRLSITPGYRRCGCLISI